MNDLKAQLIERVTREVEESFKHSMPSSLTAVRGVQLALDIVLKDAVQVYGSLDEDAGWSIRRWDVDNQVGLLINIQPMDPEVSVKEVVEHLRGGKSISDRIILADRIERYGVKS